MDEHPAAAVRREGVEHRRRPRLVKERKADVFLSAGNSGAVMAALVVLGRCTAQTDQRLAAPSRRKGSTLLLDSARPGPEARKPT
ncbi:MAG: hypothetical protein WKH64_06940 [Chloroflexia bacterium]